MDIKVVITGLGVISPNGIGKNNFVSAIKSGKSGIKKITRFDASEYPVKIAGEVNDFEPTTFIDRKDTKLISRTAQFCYAGTKLAIEDADLKIMNEDPYRVGIIFGTSTGGQEIHEQQLENFYKKGISSISPFSPISINYNSAVGYTAAQLKIKGPNLTVSTGCTSGLNSICLGFDFIRNNKADIIIAGGADCPILPFTFNAFCSARVLSKRNGNPETTSRPFDKERSGYVLSEGAGIVVLENYEHAIRRNANIYGEILGYGITNDGYSLLGMEPEGKEVVESIKLALENAGIKEVDYICAHGSSSVVADKRETKSIKEVFGEKAYSIPISSIKSMIGQPLSSAGCLQLITALIAINENFIPPTINYEYPDPECDLDYVPNKYREVKVNTALINSFGMGGNNVSIIVGKSNGRKYINHSN